MGYTANRNAPRVSLLAAVEERNLARIIERGREAQVRIDGSVPIAGDHQLATEAADARRRFMEANLGLVLKIAGSFKAPSHVDRDDLIQDGMLGLERAIERFNWRKGYKFSTYATSWIRQAIQRGLRNTATTIRIPAHRHSDLRAVLATGGDPAVIPHHLAHLAVVGSPESLDRPINDSGTTLAELVAADGDGPDRAVLNQAARRQIHHHVRTLDLASAAAIAQRFGLGGGEPATFAQIGATLGVSAEAARRRVQRALDRLRTDLQPLAA